MKDRGDLEGIDRLGPYPIRQLFFIIPIFLGCALPGFISAEERPLQENSPLQSVCINGYFDPARNFLDATARLRFSRPVGTQSFWLAEGLELSSAHSGTMPVLDIQRDCSRFLVRGGVEDELELCYSGRLVPMQDPFDSSWIRDMGSVRAESDDCRFLSYTMDFYPHSQFDFISMKMNIRIPCGWNCLGSGTLRSVRSDRDATTFMFDDPEIKGMSLVCGRFQQIGFLAGTIPVRLHGWPKFRYQVYFTDAGINRLLSFYMERFGPPGVPELNILFRRGCNFRGVSSRGLIVLNVDDSWTRLSPRTRKAVRDESPLSMIDAETDLLAHEMAHQWWGGLISWKTAADNWLTEGLATYSMLLYLRQCKGEKIFRKTCRKLQRRLKPFAKLGTPAAGVKLRLLSVDIRAYQALVYVKPALMLVELADVIGEAELCRRLRTILRDSRCRNVDTAEFLSLLGNHDEKLLGRLQEWICRPGLPDKP